ncbi:MBL fold metallo-hydrolase [Chloroflexota bacterium]
MKMEKVAENIYHLEVLIPKVEWLFAVYFINEGKGVLIEPGPAALIPSIQEAMKELGMKELEYIIPSHIHLDHAGAIGGLAQLFPQAKVVLHSLAAKHAVNPSRLIDDTRTHLNDEFEAVYGAFLPVPKSQVKVVQDGETLSINGRELQIFYAPGHATHHIVIFDRETKGLFCGEALGLPLYGADSSPLPAASPPAFDLEVYLGTIERLRKLGPQILFYSHGGVGRKPEELILRTAENTRVFGDIILNALRQGESTETIDMRLREYMCSHLGIAVEEADRLIIEGFTFYFKKNGLV